MPKDDPSAAGPGQAPLPESLKKQLEGFRRELWKIKVAEAVLAGIFGLLISYLLVFGLDRVWATPPLARLAILVGGTSLFVLFAPYWIHRWVFGHRREDQLARLIARKYPRLGDRLLGVVELQSQVESEEALSPELRGAAMKNVAREAKKREFGEALPDSRHRGWSLAVLAGIALSGAALVLVPKAGMNALKRWLMPLADTPRYTFTKFEELEDRIVVPYNEPFELALTLSKESDRRPDSGTARYGVQDPVSAELRESGQYVFSFPGQQAAEEVTFRIDDFRRTVKVVPTLRPTVEAVTAEVHYPDYLQLPVKRIDLRSGVLSVVSGSEVSLEAIASRTLDSGNLSVRELPRVVDAFEEPLEPEEPAPEDGSEEGEPELLAEPAGPAEFPLQVAERTMRSKAVSIGSLPTEMTLNWTDELQLQDTGGFRLRVEPVEDQRPTAYIQGIDRQVVILEQDTVSFEVLTEDDYGIREMGIAWQGEFTKATDEPAARGEMRLEEGGPAERRLDHEVDFAPSVLGIKPQKLTIRAYVEDYFPERGRIYSEPILVFILTPEEHAQLLKNQFDRIIGELEDAARREQNNFDENQRLERLDEDELQQEENKDRIQQQEANETENIDRMQELSERMQELFKDAVKNGEIDKETLQKMAEAMQKMGELADEDMPKVEKELNEARDERSTSEQTKKDLQEAVEEQKKVLEKMRETIEQANEANRNFEASTFINRLKRAASEEDGIATALIGRVDVKDGNDSIIGMTLEELDPVDQRLLGELALQQRRTATDVRWIQEDLGHFYARTQKEIHQELLTEMQESQIDTALDDNRTLIAGNRSGMAIGVSKKWAEQLLEWAKKLEGPEEDGGGGGGGNGDGPPPLDDNDFEFMLKVMKMIQEEQDIRARTRALEQMRRSLLQTGPEAGLPRGAPVRPEPAPAAQDAD